MRPENRTAHRILVEWENLIEEMQGKIAEVEATFIWQPTITRWTRLCWIKMKILDPRCNLLRLMRSDLRKVHWHLRMFKKDAGLL